VFGEVLNRWERRERRKKRELRVAGDEFHEPPEIKANHGEHGGHRRKEERIGLREEH
jgi:hypothetical protein